MVIQINCFEDNDAMCKTEGWNSVSQMSQSMPHPSIISGIIQSCKVIGKSVYWLVMQMNCNVLDELSMLDKMKICETYYK